eukprot:TRINITY_DN1515_c0_g1_i1.p1 TRINITY_DN1515_c0_g1~~TRINITY_DN1515_c0_g1_i1.p1  ORF type:complete len:314 (-),score=40.05 TRINITY_DN1515_c0_g1_i1:109-1050(-)
MSTIVVPAPLPSPAEDAENLRKAVQGLGTDENSIVQILGHRTAEQRRLIRDAYLKLFEEDLLKRLESELSLDFERAVYLWTLDPADRDAFIAHEALKRWNPKNKSIIEICCSRTPAELLRVRQAYHKLYKMSLEEDIAAHTSGDFRKLLVGLASTHRYEGTEINHHLSAKEAKDLRDATKMRRYDELIRIITTRSKAQLNGSLNSYKDEYGQHLNKDLKGGEKTKDFEEAVRTALKCLFTPEVHYTKVLRLSMEKLGTDEDALTRVIVTRAEVDLKNIKGYYYKRTSKTLQQAVSDDTSGDYRSFLLTLIGED